MSIPTHQEFYPSLLEILGDGKTYKLKNIRQKTMTKMNITEEQRKELLPSKKQSIFNNRIGWSLVYLKKAGVIDQPGRAKYRLTSRGKSFIENEGYDITNDKLMEFKSFKTFLEPKKENEKEQENNTDNTDDLKDITPDDQLIEAFRKIEDQLAEDLTNEIMNMSPIFFESLVLDLLYAMGYGGKGEDRKIYTTATQDDGIDGLIKEDELGLEHIYIQAKRWAGTVGQPEIQKFSGALSGQGAKKGVFITTSWFSKKAIKYADNHQASKIVLIDGKKLTELMTTYGVGLYVENTYKVQKIDTDYFNEDI